MLIHRPDQPDPAFYRPASAPLSPNGSAAPATDLPNNACPAQLIYWAALAGLLTGLALGFGGAWLAAAWSCAQ